MVEAVNKHVDPRFVDLGSFRDQTIVRVSVSDIDEPPIFQPAEGAIMEVQEDAKVGALVGIVTARDPDESRKPVRYRQTVLAYFSCWRVLWIMLMVTYWPWLFLFFKAIVAIQIDVEKKVTSKNKGSA